MDNSSYSLSRSFWDFAFENTGKIKPIHVSIFFFAIEHCNRLGWKKQFGLPTSMVLEAISVKSYSVYKSALDDLVGFGFIEMVKLSKNQYSSNVIALKENNKARTKALDKAFINHSLKQDQSTVSIDKPNNQETIKPITIPQQVAFDDFWELYEKKVDRKACLRKWGKLPYQDQCKIMQHLPMYVKSTPDKQYRKNPETYLNDNAWENEILTGKLPLSEKKENEVRPKGYPNPQSYYSTCWEKEIKPVRWENGDVLNDTEIEQQYKLHKVGPFQYA